MNTTGESAYSPGVERLRVGLNDGEEPKFLLLQSILVPLFMVVGASNAWATTGMAGLGGALKGLFILVCVFVFAFGILALAFIILASLHPSIKKPFSWGALFWLVPVFAYLYSVVRFLPGSEGLKPYIGGMILLNAVALSFYFFQIAKTRRRNGEHDSIQPTQPELGDKSIGLWFLAGYLVWLNAAKVLYHVATMALPNEFPPPNMPPIVSCLVPIALVVLRYYFFNTNSRVISSSAV